MTSFFGELRRRNVVKVAVAYAIVGWLLVQVADTFFPALRLPEWTVTLVAALVIVGFPLAVILAWAYETTPAGIRRDTGVGKEASEATRPETTRRWISSGAFGVVVALLIGVLVGALVGRSTRELPETSDVSRTPTRLTANPIENAVVSAAVSPDGRYLAYADTAGLALRLIETGETHPLPLPDLLEVTEIDWFPDGAHLLISATAENVASLWKLAVIGGEPRKLHASAWRAAISPDGNSIAFLPAMFPTREIHLMGAEGEEPSTLVDLGDKAVWELAWSPNSKWLAYGFFGRDVGSSENRIEIIDVMERTSRLVLSDARLFQTWRAALPFHWTPDGRLVYARRGLSPNQGRSNLWQISLDPETGESSGSPSQITRVTGYNFRDLSMTADGSRLAFLLESNQADVYVGELLDGGTRLAAPVRLTQDTRNDYPAGWTADSREVFFHSDRGVAQNVFRQNVQGTEATPLSTSPSAEGAVELSPDGEWILYWQEEGLEDSLVRTPVEGGPPEFVLTASGGQDFHCPRSMDISPDCVLGQRNQNNQYVFNAFNPVYGIGRELQAVEDRPPFSEWDLSPDGERVALVHNEGDVRIINLEDGVERQVIRDGWSFGEYVAWSADGSGVIVDGNPERSRYFRKALLYLPLDGRDVTVLRQEPSEWHVRIAPSPDGRWLAFGLMVFSGNAWMIEDF